MFYATCITGVTIAEKVATCSDSSFSLTTGVVVAVKFTNSNTSASPTLNVNSTGAKAIKKYGTTAPNIYYWHTGAVVEFVYDGTNWVMVRGGDASTTYYGITKLNNSITSDSVAEAATANAVNQVRQTIPFITHYTGDGSSGRYISLDFNTRSTTPVGVLVCDSRGYALGVSNNGSTSSLPGGFVPFSGRLTNPNNSSVYLEFNTFTVNGVTKYKHLYMSTANAANINGIKYYCIVFYT